MTPRDKNELVVILIMAFAFAFLCASVILMILLPK